MRTPTVDTLAEHEALFQLFNGLEVRGYRYVQNPDSADLIATVLFNDSKERTYLIPFDDLPKCNVALCRPIEQYSFGTPDSLPIESQDTSWLTYDSLGTASNVWIVLYEAKTRLPAMQVHGVGWYTMKSNSIARMRVITRSVDWIKYLESNASLTHYGSGQIGVHLSVERMRNGDWWPRIESVSGNTPAAYSDLRAGEIIVRINGTLVKNWPYTRVLDIAKGPVGKKLTLEVWNPDTGTRNVQLSLGPRPVRDLQKIK